MEQQKSFSFFLINFECSKFKTYFDFHEELIHKMTFRHLALNFQKSK